MKLRNRRISALAAVTLVAGLALTACGSSDSGGGSDGGSDGGSAGGDISVTFLPKNLGNPYFDISDAAGKAAVESFGGTFEEVGPDAASPDAQVPFINTAAQQGVSALVGQGLSRLRSAPFQLSFLIRLISSGSNESILASSLSADLLARRSSSSLCPLTLPKLLGVSV